MTPFSNRFGSMGAVVLLVSSSTFAVPTVVTLGALDNFDGPNDLNLAGAVVYAVDNGTGAVQTINGVPFSLAPTTPGVTIAGPGGPFGFTPGGAYAFTDGAAADNAALNEVMREIQCCSGGGAPHSYSFAVTPGHHYEVQVLWGETGPPGGNSLIRNWDIAIEGVLAVDQVYSDGPDTGGGPPSLGNGFGTRWTHTHIASDGSLDITLGQIGGLPFAGGDANYIVSAFIVRDVTPVPEPATTSLAVVGSAVLLLRRRRRV